MMQNEHLENIPEAIVSPDKSKFSFVWILPVLAGILGLWLMMKTLSETGPVITLQFKTAIGLVAGKTKIRYRDIDVGDVLSISFTDDLSKVIVKIQMNPVVGKSLNQQSQFWVVRPRINSSQVSGLNTLISGAYIAVDPGKDGQTENSFIGLEEPPSVTSDTQGTIFHLKSDGLGSLSVGSPVYFRQIEVGEVVSYKLSDNYEAINIAVIVRPPHDQFIYKDTRFWNIGGFDLALDAQGINLEVESLTSLLSGGISFVTPASVSSNQKVPEKHYFHLYKNLKQSQEKPIMQHFPYVLYFNDTVRGLAVGAPVELRGIRVGTVQEISMERDNNTGLLRIPVMVEIEPERVPTAELNNHQQRGEVDVGLIIMDQLVKEGLRARLQTGNFLTGKLFVELDFFPDDEKQTISYQGQYPELPTIPNALSGIANNLNGLLTKLNSLPIEALGGNLLKSSVALKTLLESKNWLNMVESLGQITKQASQLVATLNKDIPPVINKLDQGVGHASEVFANVNQQLPILVKNLATTLTVAQSTLIKAETALISANRLMSNEGEVGTKLQQTLDELSAAARSIRVMADYLERHPEALLQGKER
ncbi:MAG: MCE family protein [Methylococcales bacterium]|nr:MCE family protein [Methylococcales bacterium]MBT7409713.1 MCE family protein [Methylococcales bacterium]